MGFYYISVFSLMLLGVVYTVLLFVFWGIARLTRGMPGRKVLLTVVGAVFLLVPVGEELWITWNFGQLCRKDAGIFINKVVEVDGYYDATAGLLQINKPVLLVTAENFDKRGYKFYELSLANTKGGPSKVARFEKVNGEWVGSVLDRPKAKYHYTTNIYGTGAAHKITRQESRVSDETNGEIIGRYVEYGRRAPWFFVGLGEASYSCDGPDGGPNSMHNRLIYRETFLPKK